MSIRVLGQPLRSVLIVGLLLPVVVVAAVLAFAWPAARIAPRGVPVGIVGATPAAQAAVAALDHAQPGGFDFRLYPDEREARTAIEHRDVYGAFAANGRAVTVLEAGAASPAVAQALSTAGSALAAHAGVPLHTVDVVPLSTHDPRGMVLSSILLPLSLCASLLAAAVALVLTLRSAWRQGVTLAVVSALAGLGIYLIAQPFLGALPHEPLATWGALSLTVFAIATTASGLAALVGPAGLGLGAALMVLLGNAFAGSTSAPTLLPGAVHRLGQWLPPGAGANLVRSTAYFGGAGSAGHLTVLLLWSVAGMVVTVLGHHTVLGHAARSRARSAAPATEDTAPTEDAAPREDTATGTPRPTTPDPTTPDPTTPRHLDGAGALQAV
ncbi:ABC transporter permease [uncultured Jatrophihabitans sp.]|uniref:ABC transporter permease n=1 Tax=uncultured Jatrophihabitans sp. TaxID=1610747 RepID=UPI0035CC93C4